MFPHSHRDINPLPNTGGPSHPNGAQIRPQVSDYFENMANFNAECHTWNLHIFLVLLIKELSGKGFIRVAHMHSLLISSRDYVISSGAPRQIEKVTKKKIKEVLDG